MIIKSTKTVEHEITLPAFYKSQTMLFKIFSEEQCIAVCNDEIAIKHSGLPFILEVNECTETEFLTAFNQIFSNIYKLI
jgi:hypothetical protein